jgi:lipoate synthase
VEVLTGDFDGNLDNAALVARSGLDVFAHNIETVEAMTPYVRDRRATFRRTLSVLERAKAEGVRVTKTSMMLGVGETESEVVDTLKGLSFLQTMNPSLNLPGSQSLERSALMSLLLGNTCDPQSVT